MSDQEIPLSVLVERLKNGDHIKDEDLKRLLSHYQRVEDAVCGNPDYNIIYGDAARRGDQIKGYLRARGEL